MVKFHPIFFLAVGAPMLVLAHYGTPAGQEELSAMSASSASLCTIDPSIPTECDGSDGWYPVSVVERGVYCARGPICSADATGNCPSAQSNLPYGSRCKELPGSGGVYGCMPNHSCAESSAAAEERRVVHEKCGVKSDPAPVPAPVPAPESESESASVPRTFTPVHVPVDVDSPSSVPSPVPMPSPVPVSNPAPMYSPVPLPNPAPVSSLGSDYPPSNDLDTPDWTPENEESEHNPVTPAPTPCETSFVESPESGTILDWSEAPTYTSAYPVPTPESIVSPTFTPLPSHTTTYRETQAPSPATGHSAEPHEPSSLTEPTTQGPTDAPEPFPESSPNSYSSAYPTEAPAPYEGGGEEVEGVMTPSPSSNEEGFPVATEVPLDHAYPTGEEQAPVSTTVGHNYPTITPAPNHSPNGNEESGVVNNTPCPSSTDQSSPAEETSAPIDEDSYPSSDAPVDEEENAPAPADTPYPTEAPVEETSAPIDEDSYPSSDAPVDEEENAPAPADTPYPTEAPVEETSAPIDEVGYPSSDVPVDSGAFELEVNSGVLDGGYGLVLNPVPSPTPAYRLRKWLWAIVCVGVESFLKYGVSGPTI